MNTSELALSEVSQSQPTSVVHQDTPTVIADPLMVSKRSPNITNYIDDKHMLNPIEFATFKPTKVYFWTFIIILIVFTVIIGAIIIYNNNYSKLIFSCMESLVERTVKISFNVVNSLSNKITIGTSLGDFLANLYNAFGIYDVLNEKVSIDFADVYECFKYWLTNNDYNNVYFTEEYYNENQLETLPFYMSDYIPKGYSPKFGSSWHMQHAYGYFIHTDDKLCRISPKEKWEGLIEITKEHNTYSRLELETTPFAQWKNKFFKFLFENHPNVYKLINSNESLAINTNIMYKYYQYFIVIHKLAKEFYDCEYFAGFPDLIAGKTISVLDEKEIVMHYKNRKTIDVHTILKTNLCYNMMATTFDLSYTDKYGDVVEIKNIKILYENGFIFTKQ